MARNSHVVFTLFCVMGNSVPVPQKGLQKLLSYVFGCMKKFLDWPVREVTIMKNKEGLLWII